MLGLIPCMLLVVGATLVTEALDVSGGLKAKPPSFGIAVATGVVVATFGAEKPVEVEATIGFGATTSLLAVSVGFDVTAVVDEVDAPNLNPTNGESTVSFLAIVDVGFEAGAPNENDGVTKIKINI